MDCPPNKILNPKSKKCIAIGTQLHKSLVKEGILSPSSLTSNSFSMAQENQLKYEYPNKIDSKCTNGKVVNPKTNYCVSIGSQT